MAPLVGIPVKPFGVAKARLAPVLGPLMRARLGRAIAARTAAVAARTGADVAIVTGDAGVAAWAGQRGVAVINEPRPGLDAAARSVVTAAAGGDWAVVHADLPLVTEADLRRCLDAASSGSMVVAPASDGGSNVIAGGAPDFPFRYGPGSFHRHLRAVAPDSHRVVTSIGLALDLDSPRDLAATLAHPGGVWLQDVIDRSRSDC